MTTAAATASTWRTRTPTVGDGVPFTRQRPTAGLSALITSQRKTRKYNNYIKSFKNGQVSKIGH